MTVPSLQPRRGAALVLVLGAVVLIGIALAGVIKLTQHTNTESLRAAKTFQARQIAESGLALGLHPNLESTDPLLHQELPGGYLLDVTVTSEQGRIFINNVADSAYRDSLEELFLVWGLDADEAAVAADCLKDWVDADDDAEARGAENDFYASAGYEDYPANSDFVSLEQMLLVQGMDQVAKRKPNWRDFFTLYGDGELDINAADAEVLHAFAGVPLSNAQLFVQTRNGADGILGTSDDQVYEGSNIEDAVQLLGIPQERRRELGEIFTLEGTALRIESRATVADLSYALILIADRESGDTLSRRWR